MHPVKGDSKCLKYGGRFVDSEGFQTDSVVTFLPEVEFETGGHPLLWPDVVVDPHGDGLSDCLIRSVQMEKSFMSLPVGNLPSSRPVESESKK